MAYQPTDWRNGETALSAEHMNNIEEGIQEALNAVKPSEIKPTLVDIIYPVGSIYMSVNDTSPSILFGGTWTRWGQGRVPVGVNESETEFNAAEKADGEKTHTLTAAQMPSHTHIDDGHDHEYSHIHEIGNHYHYLNGHSHPASSDGARVNIQSAASSIGKTQVATGTSGKYAPTIGSADSFYRGGTSGSNSSGTTSIPAYADNYYTGTPAYSYTNDGKAYLRNTGGGQAHNNLQPYITCYMWKRTE